MTYLFMGMLIGGILGAAIGSLGASAYFLKKETCRLRNLCRKENENLTCLLFPFDDVQLDIGKLAMWRLHTHEQFGGTWLSDYVPNRLGGFVLCEEECDESEEMGMEMM